MLKIKNVQEKEDIYELLLKLIESFKESKLLSNKNK